MNAPLSVDSSTFDASLLSLYTLACEQDVQAFKPGNVSIESAGHNMTAEDFIQSALASAPHICKRSDSPGKRIYNAILATQKAVNCNTNLGIVLLATPLICAVQTKKPNEKSLRTGLERILSELTVEDAKWAYRAITLASPAGLGESTKQDVKEEPSVTLLDAMQIAADKDRIAYQYIYGYTDLWQLGLKSLKEARKHWAERTETPEESEQAALSMTYLSFLSRIPDSHIIRKYDYSLAEMVRNKAKDCKVRVEHCKRWSEAKQYLNALDHLLKSAKINPGTSADLSVATWLTEQLLDFYPLEPKEV